MSEYVSDDFVLTIDDVLGDFDGNTFGEDALVIALDPIIDFTAVLEDPANPDPPDYDGPVRAITNSEGETLYPIDSAFGADVTNFVGATQRNRDSFYGEGWVGSLKEGTTDIGITVTTAKTNTFKTGSPLGTWTTGLGGNTVKSSTEHYVVMQNVLSDQAFPGDPNAVSPLDNDLRFEGGIYAGKTISEVDPSAQNLNAAWYAVVQAGLVPNENTITENIAVGSDYSITKQNDGTLLYRWGQIAKSPTDVRISFSIPLPEEWTTSSVLPFLNNGFKVNQAYLVVDHTIADGSNTSIEVRPEDYSNRAATGRLPSYYVDNNGTPNNPGDDLWRSLRNSYAGDGTFLPAGTILKDSSLIVPGGASADLANGFTNAWYTTIDQDPFELAVDINPDPAVQDYIGFKTLEDLIAAGYSVDDVVKGSRWELTNSTFGQDLDNVGIPAIANSEPPFASGDLKYQAGAVTTTVLNLLDSEPGQNSPFLSSSGWTQADPDRVNEDGITENGLKLTEKLDVALHISGDINAVNIYDAHLVIDYQDVDPVFDMVWRNPSTGQSEAWFIEDGEQVGSAPITLSLADPSWKIRGIGDFDEDGERDDLFWRNTSSGQNSIWFTELTEAGVTPVGGGFMMSLPAMNWEVGGIGDFDGDGFQDDPIWFDKTSNAVSVWFLENGQAESSEFINFTSPIGSGWQIVGVGSFDGESAVDDVVWRNVLTGDNAISIMNGTTLVETKSITPVGDLNWQIVGVSDFDGDGIANDLAWRHTIPGQTNLWFMDGTNLAGGVADLQPSQPAEFVPIA
jgi:hypothetical protein